MNVKACNPYGSDHQNQTPTKISHTASSAEFALPASALGRKGNYSPPVHQIGVSPSPSGRGRRGAPGEGENAEMSRHARPHPALFLRLRPIGLALRGHLLPKGEGHARGFSLINVLNSYVNRLAAIVRP